MAGSTIPSPRRSAARMRCPGWRAAPAQRTPAATALRRRSPERAQTTRATPAHRERRDQVRRDPADCDAQHRSASRRKGLVPEARHSQLCGHRRDVRDRGLHCADALRGPDQSTAAVVGSCRDAAGNAAEAGQTFQYDATAPALAKTEAKVDKGVARIGWERAGDVVEVELLRSPGINGAKSTIVYRGNGAAFVDKTVKAGIRYRYEISVADLAGNVTTKAVMAEAAGATKSTALLAPATGSVVKAPPLLRWKAVKGATFYNVQLYRNGRKLLSTWPGRGQAQARADVDVRRQAVPPPAGRLQVVRLGRAGHPREARLRKGARLEHVHRQALRRHSNARPRRESSSSA